MSNDGKYQLITAFGGKLSVSSDYGVTFVESDSNRNWYGSGVAEEGAYMTACVFGGYIYNSINYGVDWTPTATIQNWTDISISGNGQYRLGVCAAGIYQSNDYGITFVLLADSARAYQKCCMSHNGQYRLASVYNGYLYNSNDYGVTWVERDSVRNWIGVGMHGEGNIQFACEYIGGYIYKSINYGVDFVASGLGKNWYAIGVSYTTQYVTKSIILIGVYKSHDFDDNTVQRDSVNVSCYAISVSGSGKHQLSVQYTNGKYFTSDDYGAHWTARGTTAAYSSCSISRVPTTKNTYEYYSIGDSNAASGLQASSILNWMVNTLLLYDSCYNGAVAGWRFTDGLALIPDILSTTNINKKILIHFGTNDSAIAMTDGKSLMQTLTEVKSTLDSIKALLDVAGVSIILSLVIPNNYDLKGLYPRRYKHITSIKVFNGALWEWCINNNVECQLTYFELTNRVSIDVIDGFSLIYSNESDALHFSEAGRGRAGTLLAYHALPTRNIYFGHASFPANGYQSWKTVFLTDATVTGDADTGSLNIESNSIVYFPLLPIGDLTQFKYARLITVTVYGDSCVDVYMCKGKSTKIPTSESLIWSKTTTITTVGDDIMVGIKLLGTTTGTITHICVSWELVETKTNKYRYKQKVVPNLSKIAAQDTGYLLIPLSPTDTINCSHDDGADLIITDKYLNIINHQKIGWISKSNPGIIKISSALLADGKDCFYLFYGSDNASGSNYLGEIKDRFLYVPNGDIEAIGLLDYSPSGIDMAANAEVNNSNLISHSPLFGYDISGVTNDNFYNASVLTAFLHTMKDTDFTIIIHIKTKTVGTGTYSLLVSDKWKIQLDNKKFYIIINADYVYAEGPSLVDNTDYFIVFTFNKITCVGTLYVNESLWVQKSFAAKITIDSTYIALGYFGVSNDQKDNSIYSFVYGCSEILSENKLLNLKNNVSDISTFWTFGNVARNTSASKGKLDWGSGMGKWGKR
jgi:hypothetical protein